MFKVLNKNISVWMAVVLYLVVPNVLFWLIATALKLNRPIFNLDYIFIGLLLVVGWRKVSVLMLGIFLLAEVLVLTGLIYPFVRLQDVFYLLSLLPYAGFFWQAAAVTLLLFLICLIAIFYYFGHKANRLAVLVLFNLGIIIHGTYVYGSEISLDGWYRVDEKLINSQMLLFISSRTTLFADTFYEKGHPLVSIGYNNGTAQWVNTPPEKLNKKLLLIVVESWGVMKDQRIQEAFLSPLLAKASHFDWFQVGKIQGSGATGAAELRELCGLDTRHFNLKPVTDGFQDCLPWKLKKLGYSTASIYGSAGVIYDFVHWYPRAGFDEINFRETYAWKTHCYSFPGVCDSEIMVKYIAHAFEKDEKRFVHWLTLNTHAIYDKRDIHEDRFDCKAHQLNEDSETCRLSKLHTQFFYQFAQIISAPSMKGVEVLMVGDHPPRILNQEESEKNIEQGLVSTLRFRVKD